MEKHKCVLCEKIFYGYGNNPEPLASIDEFCCDDCNLEKVVPARLKHYGR